MVGISMPLVPIICLYLKIYYVLSYTHWIVTENGIQAQVDSACALKKPYDLVSFLEQEHRMQKLEELKLELLDQKSNLDISTDVKDLSDIDKWFYKKDSDCKLAEKPLIQIDLFVSTIITPESLGIDQNDYIPFYSSNKSPTIPDCTQIIDLSFGSQLFDHLESMSKRVTLVIPSESSIKSALPFVDSVTEYGHLINEALMKNRTSWILYDMATFYWRIKGDASKALDCVRRSLHYSPHHYKHIALVNLANILNRAGNPGDALEVLEYAQSTMVYEDFLIPYMIGNVFALLTNYTESIVAFRQSLKIRPNFQPAIQRLHAVLCHNKLIQALEDQHNSLQKTLNNLQDFQKKHETWTKLYEKVSGEMVPLDLRLQQLAIYEEMITQYETDSASDDSTSNKNFKSPPDDALAADAHNQDDAITVTRNLPPEFYTNIMEAPALKMGRRNHKLIVNLNGMAEGDSNDKKEQKRAGKGDGSGKGAPASTFKSRPRVTNRVAQGPASNLLADRRIVIEKELSRLRSGSGSTTTFLDRAECLQLFKHFSTRELKANPPLSIPYTHAQAISYAEFFGSHFITPEDKGWPELAPLLNENQGINPDSNDPKILKQHPLPWKAPVCSEFGKIDCRVANCYQEVAKELSDKIEAYQNDLHKSKIKEIDLDLSKILLSYIDTMYEPTEDEVGQRILTALKMGNEKNWALYNMASLYWRTIGNVTQALECLHRSFYYCPQKYTIVPLLNLASLFATSLKAYKQSLILLREAYALDNLDPTITMLMGHLLYLTGNLTGAEHFYKETLLLDAPPDAPHSINKEALVGYELVGCRLAFPDKYTDLMRIKENEFKMHYKGIDRMDPYGAEYDDLNDKSYLITFETFNLTGDTNEESLLDDIKDISGRQETHKSIGMHSTLPPTTSDIINLDNLKRINQNLDSSHMKSSHSLELIDPRNLEGVPDFKTPSIDEYDEDCLEAVAIDFTNVPSTWISLPSKYFTNGILMQSDVDALTTSLSGSNTEPFCKLSQSSLITREMDEEIFKPLANVYTQIAFQNEKINGLEPSNFAETGLLTVLKKHLKSTQKFQEANLDILGHSLDALIIKSNPDLYWISTTLAALYWRIKGNVTEAIRCLDESLRHTPPPNMDSGLVSLGTVLQKIGFPRLAVRAIRKALDISPKAVIIHFTMANILAAQGDFDNAMLFYGSTLALQDFMPAKVKLQSILCLHKTRTSSSLLRNDVKEEL